MIPDYIIVLATFVIVIAAAIYGWKKGYFKDW